MSTEVSNGLENLDQAKQRLGSPNLKLRIIKYSISYPRYLKNDTRYQILKLDNIAMIKNSTAWFSFFQL